MSLFKRLKQTSLALALVAFTCLPVVAEAPQFDPHPPLSELWVQTSAEYRALCYQAYGTAQRKFNEWAPLLEKREDGKAYLPGSSKPAAIILDLDETVIDNIGFQAFTVRTGAEFNPALWDAWIKFQAISEGAARAVPGSVDFLNAVEEMGVTPFYITNRDLGMEDDTAKVLERVGINVEGINDRMLFRASGKDADKQALEAFKRSGQDPESAEAEVVLVDEGRKEGRRLIVKEDYDVLAYFGDVYSDFHPYINSDEDPRRHFEQRQSSADDNQDKWGQTWYILPNPMYGYWGIGQTIPVDEVKSSLDDFGFEIYLRGRRLIR